MTLLSSHFPPQLILLSSEFKYIIPSNKLLVYHNLTYLRSKSPQLFPFHVKGQHHFFCVKQHFFYLGLLGFLTLDFGYFRTYSCHPNTCTEVRYDTLYNFPADTFCVHTFVLVCHWQSITFPW